MLPHLKEWPGKLPWAERAPQEVECGLMVWPKQVSSPSESQFPLGFSHSPHPGLGPQHHTVPGPVLSALMAKTHMQSCPQHCILGPSTQSSDWLAETGWERAAALMSTTGECSSHPKPSSSELELSSSGASGS